MFGTAIAFLVMLLLAYVPGAAAHPAGIPVPVSLESKGVPPLPYEIAEEDRRRTMRPDRQAGAGRTFPLAYDPAIGDRMLVVPVHDPLSASYDVIKPEFRPGGPSTEMRAYRLGAF
jgi:hypothetical protein